MQTEEFDKILGLDLISSSVFFEKEETRHIDMRGPVVRLGDERG